MRFVLEYRTLPFDFQYELYRQKEYYDWLNRGKAPELRTGITVCTESELGRVWPDHDPKEWCPVGSVEFCTAWYGRVWGRMPLPKNVPDELIPRCSRKILDMEKDEWVRRSPDPERPGNSRFEHFPAFAGDSVFIKDKLTVKSPWNGIRSKDDGFCDEDHRFHSHFQASEVIPEIFSEWRCFVLDGKLVDIKNYAGDPFNVPNREYVDELIAAYGSAPTAYTLDVCQCTYGTEVVEVHDFFSCGLYGLNSPKYPFMLWRWFREYTGTAPEKQV